MSRETRVIEPADIMDMRAYSEQRKALRLGHVETKKKRRLSVGPHVTVFFESYDSMWLQIHEMLYIERGGAEQIPDEIAAYNPMIPNGRELTVTLMFEIDDPKLRASILGRLAGVEDHIYLHLGEARIAAVPEGDVERSREDGKASSVHFLHFPFTQEQIAEWRSGRGTVIFGIDHPNYGHMAIIGPEMRDVLGRDFV
ncbi:MAG: DUF3501 family protein [Sphingosinicella sp.]|nr:DUF3501 family protein [Sphingosinicella sp.]